MLVTDFNRTTCFIFQSRISSSVTSDITAISNRTTKSFIIASEAPTSEKCWGVEYNLLSSPTLYSPFLPSPFLPSTPPPKSRTLKSR